MTKILTAENFDLTLRHGPDVTAVRFSAEWCGPCKMMAPMFRDVAAEMQETVEFGEVDIDKSPELALRFGIQGVPAVVLFKGQEVIDRMTGATSKSSFVRFLSRHIG